MNMHDLSKRDLWYLVGLITSDGSLSKDGRHLNITSKDKDFLDEVAESMGLSMPRPKWGGGEKAERKVYYQIQFSNVVLYRFLLDIGLMPRKSLILTSVDVPEEWFDDFLRGEIDGDGCIRNWKHPTNSVEQWSLTIVSGSLDFLTWISGRIAKQYKVSGHICTSSTRIPILKYGKVAAKVILKRCYYDDCLCLKRKQVLANKCVSSRAVWSKSKTIMPGCCNW